MSRQDNNFYKDNARGQNSDMNNWAMYEGGGYGGGRGGYQVPTTNRPTNRKLINLLCSIWCNRAGSRAATAGPGPATRLTNTSSTTFPRPAASRRRMPVMLATGATETGGRLIMEAMPTSSRTRTTLASHCRAPHSRPETRTWRLRRKITRGWKATKEQQLLHSWATSPTPRSRSPSPTPRSLTPSPIRRQLRSLLPAPVNWNRSSL